MKYLKGSLLEVKVPAGMRLVEMESIPDELTVLGDHIGLALTWREVQVSTVLVVQDLDDGVDRAVKILVEGKIFKIDTLFLGYELQLLRRIDCE